jgi:hypothetical protein
VSNGTLSVSIGSSGYVFCCHSWVRYYGRSLSNEGMHLSRGFAARR